MGPAPQLSTYQAAANAIYQPQLQGDITTAKNTETGDIANEEALKGQVQTDYQSAIDKLTQTTNTNVGKINQLYTERLGGNFSGLQGNDLGTMFATASQNQATIESTRANKLAAIATTETNDQNTYDSTVQSLTSKYQGEEADYADTAYSAAVKQANTDQLNQEKLAISEAKLGISEAKASDGPAPTLLSNAQGLNQTLTANSGSDKYVSPQELGKAFNAWTAAGETAADFFKYANQFINPKNTSYKYYLPNSAISSLPAPN